MSRSSARQTTPPKRTRTPYTHTPNYATRTHARTHARKQSRDNALADAFDGLPPDALFPPCVFDGGRPGRGGMAAGWEALGSKFALVAALLGALRERTDDKVVIVSNYTQVITRQQGEGDGWWRVVCFVCALRLAVAPPLSAFLLTIAASKPHAHTITTTPTLSPTPSPTTKQTLDLFGQLCRERGWGAIRLDGSTSVTKRTKLVAKFNDPKGALYSAGAATGYG